MADCPLDLGWMRVFEAVGRLGSLTAAAGELGLTQPAVSYVVRALEAQVGTALIVRQHRGSSLTPAGAAMYRAVGVAIAQLQGAAREIRNLQSQSVVRLFTDYGFASLWLMPRVAAFRKAWPEADVHIVASASLDPGQADAVDLSILFGARADFGPAAVQLFEEEVVPVCSPAFALRHGLSAAGEGIAGLPLLHLDSTPRPRWFIWRDWLAAMAIERRPGPADLSLSTYGLVVQAAMADQGIALGWTCLIGDALSAGSLVAVGPPIVRPQSGYWMVPAASLSAPAAALAAWMVREAGTVS